MLNLLARHRLVPEQRIAQKALAQNVTEVVHGSTSAQEITKLSELLFDKTTDFSKLTTFQLKRFTNFLPTTAQGQDLVDVLVSTSLASSKKKAREFITSGAISVAGTKATKNFCISYPALIKKGRNSFAIVQ